MVDKRKKLKTTAAGNELAKETKKLLKQQKEASRKLQELSKKSPDEVKKKALMQELDEANQKIRNASEQLTVLKLGVFERLFESKPDPSLVPQVGEIQQN
ncbi:hypothetical protein FRB91_007767 [Serendipita sp. 411]|nr:hypothetical protein FRB91_007767 [Serendipita sp. 411]